MRSSRRLSLRSHRSPSWSRVGQLAPGIAVMLFLAMPGTALALALIEWSHQEVRAEGFWNVLGAAAFLVYVWGFVTGIPLSVVHTGLVAASGRGALWFSALAGLLLGGIAGAATPSVFTGFLSVEGVVAGAFTGLLYGVLVPAVSRWSGKPQAARDWHR